MNKAVILLSLFLTACVQPVNHDPAFSGLAAQATGTRAAVVVALTSAAYQSTQHAAMMAQQAAMTGTAVSVQATATSQIVTQAAIVQVTRESQATATMFQQSKEEIALEAHGTRERMATDATVTAVHLQIKEEMDKATRSEWFWTFAGIIVLLVAMGMGAAGVGVVWRNANTVRDSNGDVIFYQNKWIPTDAPLVLPSYTHTDPPRFATHNSANGSRGVNLERRAVQLSNNFGELIYEFSGRQIDQIELNILNGDRGFRRDTSGQGKGLDELIGLRNNTTFSKILDELRQRGYIRPDGPGHSWTNRGMVEFLQMTTLPHR